MAAALNWSKVRPSMVAVATRFRAPFKVQTSGRNSPVASANPATTPELSWVCSPVSVNTVPLVPSETSEEQLIAATTQAVQALYERHNRMQENAGVVVGLLGAPELVGRK